MAENENSRRLAEFIQKSPTSYHLAEETRRRLQAAGYEQLLESSAWKLKAGGKYYVLRNASAIAAFRIPETAAGFMIMASHADSPVLKLKENPEIREHDCTRLNVEVYGGALLAPWFDRPLSAAGRIFVREEGQIACRLVDLDRDLLVIPSLAIHMNRQANDGFKLNPQKDLLPLLGPGDCPSILQLVTEKCRQDQPETAFRPEDILGSDLYIYCRERPFFWGPGNEYLSSPRLDDAACAFSSLEGFLRAEKASAGDHIPVHIVFDNEEVGSSTKQGAASTFLKDTLRRISACLGCGETEHLQLLAESFMLSGDNAHAMHPNYPEKCDPVNRVRMGKGVVIKYSANQKYTTDAMSAAVVRLLAERAGISLQVFSNRSDIPGGSTLGNLSGNQAAIPTADIGIAQLAMHSPCECIGCADVDDMIALAETFFQASLREAAYGRYRI
ncbi:MAG: M18 family aminopeptidase [Lachnospiraceae bacterium]|nr:M18 family aminopeptidase [Lachnospiraceae bacterium]